MLVNIDTVKEVLLTGKWMHCA